MAGSSTDEEAGKILKPSLRIFFSILSYKRLEIGRILMLQYPRDLFYLKKNVICYICKGPEAMISDV